MLKEKTYGSLYEYLFLNTHEIPIGIYRTDKIKNNDTELVVDKDSNLNNSVNTNMLANTNKEIEKIVKSRMNAL